MTESRSVATSGPRILMVSMWYPPATGGLPRQAQLLCRTLAALGTTVRVVTMAGRGAALAPDGVPVHRLPTVRDGGRRLRGYPWLPFLAAFLVAHRGQYELIHVHEALHAAALCVALGHRLGKKCVVKVAGSGATGNLAVLKSWKWSGPVALRLLRRADAVVSLSREVTAELVSSGIPAKAIVDIPNGVELGRFQGAAPIPGLSRSVIATARLSGEKGLDLLIWAWPLVSARVPGWRVAVLGEGPERETLQRLAQAVGAGEAVGFPGEVSDVAPYLAGSRVFVLPSRHGEGMSNALLEAMAAGCACLASNIEANAQLIEPGVTGDLFRSEDVDDLATRLSGLLADEDRRRRLGEAAAARVAERYAIESVARRYQELYRRLIAGDPAGGREAPSRQT